MLSSPYLPIELLEHTKMNVDKTADSIEALLKANRDLLGSDTVTAAVDYLEHGEPEMALEGLCLDLMKHERKAVHMNREDVLDLVRQLGLDQEPTFDAEFWQKLNAFL